MEAGEQKGMGSFIGRSETPLFLGRIGTIFHKCFQMVFLKQCPELLLVFIEMNGCFQLLCIQIFEKECIFNTTRKKIKQDLLQLTGIDGSTKCRESYMESGR